MDASALSFVVDSGRSTPEHALKREDIETIVGTWQLRLQLTHWQIAIAWHEPLDPEEEKLAEIDRPGSYDYATLRLARNWTSWSRRWANLTIAHELMHLHSRDLEYAGESVEPVLNQSSRALWRARFEHEIEAVIDKLATLFVDLAGDA